MGTGVEWPDFGTGWKPTIFVNFAVRIKVWSDRTLERDETESYKFWAVSCQIWGDLALKRVKTESWYPQTMNFYRIVEQIHGTSVLSVSSVVSDMRGSDFKTE